jgi:hypothetical protein
METQTGRVDLVIDRILGISAQSTSLLFLQRLLPHGSAHPWRRATVLRPHANQIFCGSVGWASVQRLAWST